MWQRISLIKQFQAPYLQMRKIKQNVAPSYVEILCVRYDMKHYIKCQVKILISISVKLKRILFIHAKHHYLHRSTVALNITPR